MVIHKKLELELLLNRVPIYYMFVNWIVFVSFFFSVGCRNTPETVFLLVVWRIICKMNGFESFSRVMCNAMP